MPYAMKNLIEVAPRNHIPVTASPSGHAGAVALAALRHRLHVRWFGAGQQCVVLKAGIDHAPFGNHAIRVFLFDARATQALRHALQSEPEFDLIVRRPATDCK